MRFDDAQQTHIDWLIETRLAQQRRQFDRERAAERERHGRELETLRSEILRLESERSVLRRLSDRWFTPRPRAEHTR